MNKVYNRFQTKTAQNVKNCTPCGATYRYGLYKGVRPPVSFDRVCHLSCHEKTKLLVTFSLWADLWRGPGPLKIFKNSLKVWQGMSRGYCCFVMELLLSAFSYTQNALAGL